MDITYLGHSSFKIKTKTATVVTDPYLGKSEADIVTISHEHSDHNNLEKVSGYKKVLNGAGEYEVMGVSVLGFNTYHDDKKGEERGKNVIYVIEAEGLRIAHLGDLGHELSTELVDDMGSIDILMLPVGGVYTIDAKQAASVVSKIEPYYVIPMHYKNSKLKSDVVEKLSPVEDFVKELGAPSETLPKLSIKKVDITEDQNTRVVVLESK